jgi:hypothetical protein
MADYFDGKGSGSPTLSFKRLFKRLFLEIILR